MKRLIVYTILSYFCITSMSWADCIKGNCYNVHATVYWGEGKCKGDKYIGEWKDDKSNGK